jgi:hypothetical protein
MFFGLESSSPSVDQHFQKEVPREGEQKGERKVWKKIERE